MGPKKTVCVDLDGVLADYSKGWQGVDSIGDPIPGAVEFTKRLGKYAVVVIYTTRCKGKMFDRDEKPEILVGFVKAWLDRHGFHYDDIDTGQGKPIAAAYCDDRAVVCRPQEGNPHQAFEDAEHATLRLLGR
jgi:hypothetical protein